MTDSEFGGKRDRPRHGLQPKGSEALTPGEKLRLVYQTGQEQSSDVENDDGSAWRGEVEGGSFDR